MTDSPRLSTNRTPRDLVITGVLALVMLAAFAWWWHTREMAGADMASRLQQALDRGADLKRQIAGLRPPEPDCPPGTSVKTFSPDATPPATPGSGSAIAKPDANAASGAIPGVTPGASSPANGAYATVLPDFALAQKLEQAAAMVVVSNGRSMISGTGFFIAPNLLMTNRHVVDQATADNIMLISRSLGKPRRVAVLFKTQVSQVGNSDFALLKLIDGTAPGVLPVSTQVGKLSSVVAAGYPDVVMENDGGFQRLLHGDASTPPEMNMTQGAVQTVLPGNGVQIVVHTASINHGNSGGPLVDACGRAVGINTFISVDQGQASKVNNAIGGVSIEDFLQAAGVQLPPDTRPCGIRN